MFRPRIIPVLLLKENGLVKSVKFRNYKYLGDPVNAVRIFNDMQADELVFLDILASKQNRLISTDFVRNVSEESNMPFAVGGGIKTLDDIRLILNNGADRVVINTSAVLNINFVKEASAEFGVSTVMVCVDVKRNIFGKYEVRFLNGLKKHNINLLDYCKALEDSGAGEIILQSIDNDGMMSGYDLNLISSASGALNIPVTALGGAGSYDDVEKCFSQGNASGIAAGSLFVFQSKGMGVLINYKKNVK